MPKECPDDTDDVDRQADSQQQYPREPSHENSGDCRGEGAAAAAINEVLFVQALFIYREVSRARKSTLQGIVPGGQRAPEFAPETLLQVSVHGRNRSRRDREDRGALRKDTKSECCSSENSEQAKMAPEKWHGDFVVSHVSTMCVQESSNRLQCMPSSSKCRANRRKIIVGERRRSNAKRRNAQLLREEALGLEPWTFVVRRNELNEDIGPSELRGDLGYGVLEEPFRIGHSNLCSNLRAKSISGLRCASEFMMTIGKETLSPHANTPFACVVKQSERTLGFDGIARVNSPPRFGVTTRSPDPSTRRSLRASHEPADDRGLILRQGEDDRRS